MELEVEAIPPEVAVTETSIGSLSMKFVEIPLKSIVQNENSRVIYKVVDLAELMGSMKRDGLLQPVGVRKLPGGKYDAVWGNRRIVAAKKLDWKTIPAHIVEADADTDRDLIGMIENMKRANTSVQEDGRMFQSLVVRGLSKQEIAARLDVPVARIELALEVVEHVPEEYRKKIVYSAKGAGPKHTKLKDRIPASSAAALLNIRATNKLNRSKTRAMFKYVSENQTPVEALQKVGPLLKEGYSMAQALEEVGSLQRITFSILMPQKTAEKLALKYKKSINSILVDRLLTFKDLQIRESNQSRGVRLRKSIDRL